MNEDYIERQWCEDFDTLLGYGTDSRAHYRCCRCGGVYRWSGFRSIKIGPCRLPAPRAVYDGALS